MNRYFVALQGGELNSLVAQYESLPFERVHAPLLGCLPSPGALVLDVGGGSGRDAAWIAAQGCQVVVVEPSEGLREAGRLLHPDPRIRWVPDALPGLDALCRAGLAFDFILLSAVWMFVHPTDRTRAFRKLAALLAPGGRIAFTLREGPEDPSRGSHPVSAAHLEALARDHALAPVLSHRSQDQLGRPELQWTTLVFQLPDDGTGALPFLRSVILRDRKSSTYKLALLRSLCRIAEDQPASAREAEDGRIQLPLGLVALNWLRGYLPLVRRGLSQHRQEAQGFLDTLKLLDGVEPTQLHLGMRFQGGAGERLGEALRRAGKTIRDMPVKYITLPGTGTPVFRAELGRIPRRATLTLDEPTLWSFGTFEVPAHIWRAMTRLASWIDPVLRQAWAEYMTAPEGNLGEGWNALRWVDPERDTLEVRDRIRELEAAGTRLYCVWTGRSLQLDTLDVDHCFPMALWPCQDLWNLMPSSASENRRKGDRLVSAEKLEAARERILDWWDIAYLRGSGSLPERFRQEASFALPLAVGEGLTPEGVFQGLQIRRAVLGRDHSLETWE